MQYCGVSFSYVEILFHLRCVVIVSTHHLMGIQEETCHFFGETTPDQLSSVKKKRSGSDLNEPLPGVLKPRTESERLRSYRSIHDLGLDGNRCRPGGYEQGGNRSTCVDSIVSFPMWEHSPRLRR